MPPLRRYVKTPLLKNGPHIAEPPPQPQLENISSDDHERDPESSTDDDSDDGRNADIPASRWHESAAVQQKVNPRRVTISASKIKPPSRPAADPFLRQNQGSTKALRGNAAASIGDKRTRSGDKVDWSSDIDDDDLVTKPVSANAKEITSADDALENVIFNSSQQRGSQTTYRASQGTTTNIHADSSKTTAAAKKTKKDGKPTFARPRDIKGPPLPSSRSNGFKNPSITIDILQETNQNKARFIRPRTPPASARHNESECMSSPLTVLPSDLSSPPPSSVLSENEVLTSPSSPSSSMTSKTVECPLCRQLVDRTFHIEFMADLGRDRMRARDKLRFCEMHNAAAAQADWNKSDYPTIDWKALPRRLKELDSTVAGILTRRIHSTYRTALQNAVADDKVNYRHAMRNPEAQARIPIAKVVDEAILIPSSGAAPASSNTVPEQVEDEDGNSFASTGYYGPRGSRVILDHVVSSPLISQRLREVSANEDLFKRVGIPYFLQVVIVPEIAWRLIREDMGLGGDQRTSKRRKCEDQPEEGEMRAKEILLESKKAGDLINGADEEDITEIVAPDLNDEYVELSD